MTELTLEQLPMHELKSRCKKAGLKFKNNSKKTELIEVLLSGKSNIEEKKEPKRAPTLQESAKPKAVSLLPEGFDMNIKVRFPTLAYEIDEKNNCINFFAKNFGDRGVVPSCVNIDSNERIIYKVAEEAANIRRGGRPIIDTSNNVQAARIDQEKREKELERQKILSEINS
ncbi:MAG: hypothetical protein Unbinned5081contig1002_66 [Prokaryotic dsDNA virus sp.]|nr:MAG: hypothetical protein Unbinned5081contig1002_66 [Prokaryotic dsDNA virus sp.]|tara:strand:+ start:7786 stop:8298 length:513 start_codon:yes stop_codon:yes gene_type:complete